MNNKILMVSFSHYPRDPRIRREAETLVKNNFDVEIICLRRKNELKIEVFNNVKIYRVNLEKKRGEILTYIKLYALFYIIVFIKLNHLLLKKDYSFFHFHNMPNFLVFTAIIPKIMGKKIILDMHDPMPELLSSTIKKNNKFIKQILILEEKLSIKFVDRIITTNVAFKDLFVLRGCPVNKVSIIMNSPQTDIFNKINTMNRDDNKFVLLYNGSIVERHGLDILVDAINELKNTITNIELKIFGTGEFWGNVEKKIEELRLQDYVKYYGGVILDDLIYYIATCDVGVIPNRFNEFTNLNFPIRIFEYIHFKKPVIVPRTKGISDYFPEDTIFYFNPLIPNDLANQIYYIYKNRNYIDSRIEKCYNIYRNLDWRKQGKVLLEIYKQALEKK